MSLVMMLTTHPADNLRSAGHSMTLYGADVMREAGRKPHFDFCNVLGLGARPGRPRSGFGNGVAWALGMLTVSTRGLTHLAVSQLEVGQRAMLGMEENSVYARDDDDDDYVLL
eukprot:CAMPEP_0119347474 /NCGR_PEP_ID=MMETSP1333-20130426/108543_1 /TAXON_ID=418940 /ORGANISM="Scyphosphaera apsteinii, Strain RCC1455" /LENGTH=112 /DNA_ID=CAMNT_0007360021 /DNA_START=1219 /DNA_END=1555 /DNA_ORIENTATION=-